MKKWMKVLLKNDFDYLIIWLKLWLMGLLKNRGYLLLVLVDWNSCFSAEVSPLREISIFFIMIQQKYAKETKRRYSALREKKSFIPKIISDIIAVKSLMRW